MIETAITYILILLPAGVANMSPIFASKLPVLKELNQRIDFGLELRGKPLMGKNKTWRGFVSGVLAGLVTMAFLVPVVDFLGFDITKDFEINYLLLGGILGAGAIIGDAVESIIKRQLDIKPGQSLYFFDQTDYIIGAMLMVSPFVQLPWEFYLFSLFFWAIIHLVTTYLGFKLNLKDAPI